jgi:hypothetical protein
MMLTVISTLSDSLSEIIDSVDTDIDIGGRTSSLCNRYIISMTLG